MTKVHNPLTIVRLPVGQMAANCYLVQDAEKDELLIIDPGEDANYIAEHVTKLGGKPLAIVATHGHFDHIMGARELQLTFGIPFYIHEKDEFLVARMKETAKFFLKRDIVEIPPSIDRFVQANDRLGNLIVMHTPGHTPGSICLAGAGVAFTGDTIFADGAVGRTDFSYSEKHALDASVSRILSLSDSTKLYSGHGEATTVQKEKKYHTIQPWH